MPVKDLSIYSLEEIHEMREKAIESFKVIQKSVVGIPDSEIPTKKSIELHSLQKVIKKYEEEIETRSLKTTPILHQKEAIKEIPKVIRIAKLLMKNNIILVVLPVFIVAFSIFYEEKDTKNSKYKNESAVPKLQPPYRIYPEEECSIEVAGAYKYIADEQKERYRKHRQALKYYKKSLIVMKCYHQREDLMSFYAVKLIEFSDYYCEMAFFTEAENIIHEACSIRESNYGVESFESKECKSKLIEIQRLLLDYERKLDRIKIKTIDFDSISEQTKIPSKSFK